jgi:hypothetical protein
MTDERSQSRHTGSGRSVQKAETETRRIAKKALRRSDKHELGKFTGPIEPESAADEQSDSFFWQKKPEDETQ